MTVFEGKIRRSFASLRDKMAIVEKLDEVSSVGADGIRRYDVGYNDTEVARAVNETTETAINKGHVASVRREIYPQMEVKPGNNKGSSREQRLRNCEAALQAVADWAGEGGSARLRELSNKIYEILTKTD